jgi:hypothetical protein
VSEVDSELNRQKARAIGVRVADDPKSPCEFAVICVTHRVIGRGLTLGEARNLMSAHIANHASHT